MKKKLNTDAAPFAGNADRSEAAIQWLLSSTLATLAREGHLSGDDLSGMRDELTRALCELEDEDGQPVARDVATVLTLPLSVNASVEAALEFVLSYRRVVAGAADGDIERTLLPHSHQNTKRQ